MIVQDQMFIDLFDIEIICHTKLFGKNFYIIKINEHLISNNSFKTKKLRG